MLLYHILLRVLAAKELAARAAKADWSGIKARLGRVDAAPEGATIWLHAASNGEIASAKPVIRHLLDQGHRLLVTLNTDTGVALAKSWALPNLFAQLAPLDLPGPTRRIYRDWGITAHITLESDLWPHRILACPGPVIVLGGRLTERSAKGWRRFPKLVGRVMKKITFLSAQDTGSMRRFEEFGLSDAAKGPVFDLKALYEPPDAPMNATLKSAFDRDTTWLAASTHEGDEDIVLEAHKRLLNVHPTARLILAPRHPRRADVIINLIRQHGLSFAQRSKGENPETAQVYLADTMGDMHLWYALAGITLVAGSFSDRGGHTPYEPAHFRSAILHGTDTANFEAAYEKLARLNGAICVDDAASLADALESLMTSKTHTRLGAAAHDALLQDVKIDTLMQHVIAALNA